MTNRADKIKQAQALLHLNRLAEAAAIYGELCQADSRDAESHYMHGALLGKLGKFADAAECFRQVISLQPQAAMAHFGLGSSLKQQRRLLEAAGCLEQAIRLRPDMAGAYYELGTVLHALGRTDEAKGRFLQAHRLNPTAETHFSIGKIQFSQGQVIESIASFESALQLNSNRPDIHSTLAFSLFSMGRHPEAIESCNRALKIAPGFTQAHINLGRALTSLGRLDEAVSAFKEALRFDPGLIRASACIVAAYEMAGEFQKAEEYLSPLIEKYPDDATVAMVFARLCKQMGRCNEAVDMIERVLQQDNLQLLDRRELLFFLGKLYDARGAYDTAFMNYQKANSTQTLPYDPAGFTAGISEVISVFSRDLMQRLPRASHNSERPVFIIGMPRSGTSLVEQILASHSQVYGAGELRDISDIVAKLGSAPGFPKAIHNLTSDAINTLAERYLSHLNALSKDAVRVTDKMPHNFLYLGLINLLFPNARVIHCMRDPLDTCLSIYFQYFNASHAYASDLKHTGTHYLEYERLMAHWRTVIDIPMLEVRYEDIVTRPEEMIPKLVEFCGLEWQPDCLRFYETRRIVTTVSYDQVRQPLHPKSIGRWRHYEGHLDPLKTALGLTT